jgi:hypothetical protein
MDKPTPPDPDPDPDEPRVFRDTDGNEVPQSGGPRIKLPFALAKHVLDAPLEEREAVANRILKWRAKQERKKAIKEKLIAEKKAKRKEKRQQKRKAKSRQR